MPLFFFYTSGNGSLIRYRIIVVLFEVSPLFCFVLFKTKTEHHNGIFFIPIKYFINEKKCQCIFERKIEITCEDFLASHSALNAVI